MDNPFIKSSKALKNKLKMILKEKINIEKNDNEIESQESDDENHKNYFLHKSDSKHTEKNNKIHKLNKNKKIYMSLNYRGKKFIMMTINQIIFFLF